MQLFSYAVHYLAPKNKKLLEIREKIQKSIDSFHLERKSKSFNFIEYKRFLKKIDYIKNVVPNFKIQTKNVDKEISSICGPQLVCPVSNARFLLNAANARWVSLYDSLDGSNISPETKGAVKGKTYNPIRGKKVIEYTRELLDRYIHLKNRSWNNLDIVQNIINGKLNIELKNKKQITSFKKKNKQVTYI